ncbi:MAG: metallo-beta-lactamase family protein [Pirellulaceae bacterium]|jgi:metallo-beta-lactamase family protein
MCRSQDESKAIRNVGGPCIIMATSGMCTAGRIKHHLRANIENRNSTILFVGYQGRGTLGRQILEGSDRVRIHGRLHDVKADVRQIFGFSGHADRSALLKWLTNISKAPRQVFLTHGEEKSAEALSKTITDDLGWNVTIPDYKETIELD